MSRSQFAVYQLKKKPELRNLFFRTYEELAQDQIPVQVANYEQVYLGTMKPGETPKQIKKELEEKQPHNYKGHAVSTELKASDLTADGKHILMFLEEEKEPTEHILNEMMEQEEAFAGYAEQIIFVVRSKEALETPTLSKALAKLKNIQIYYDDFSEIINTLGRRMYVDPDKLPLIIVTNGSLNGIYATSGYNVGTGDMLLRLM